MNLELLAMRWLRFDCQYPIVIRERSPRYGHGQPDVLGVSKSRYLTEIEIKRSVSDFRADFKKQSRVLRHFAPERYPKLFYYLAPTEVARKIIEEVPQWAGLLEARAQEITVIKRAPVNSQSKRLSVKECVRLVVCMANHIVAAETAVDTWSRRYAEEADYVI